MENERRMQIGVMGSAQDLNYGKRIEEILAKEYAQILFRYQNPKLGSATTDMFSTPNGVETKLMEESFEVTKASMGKEGSRSSAGARRTTSPRATASASPAIPAPPVQTLLPSSPAMR